MPFALRRSHPQFWVSVIGDLIVYFSVGATWTLGPERWAGSPAYELARIRGSMRPWGVAFLAIGFVALYGVAVQWRWMRRALIAGAGVSAVMVLAFVVAAVRGTLMGTYGPATALFFVICQLAQVGEPPENPLSQSRQRGP